MREAAAVGITLFVLAMAAGRFRALGSRGKKAE